MACSVNLRDESVFPGLNRLLPQQPDRLKAIDGLPEFRFFESLLEVGPLLDEPSAARTLEAICLTSVFGSSASTDFPLTDVCALSRPRVLTPYVAANPAAIEVQSLPEFMNVVVLALVGLLDLGRHLLDVGRMDAVQHHTRENLLMSEILLSIRAQDQARSSTSVSALRIDTPPRARPAPAPRNPCFRAFCEDFRLPRSVTGPREQPAIPLVRLSLSVSSHDCTSFSALYYAKSVCALVHTRRPCVRHQRKPDISRDTSRPSLTCPFQS